MLRPSYFKDIVRPIAHKILSFIFFLRSFKNSSKIIINNNINNCYIPNLLVKNVIKIDPIKIKYKNSIPMKFRKKSTSIISNFSWKKKNKLLIKFEKQHHTYVSCRELFVEGLEVEKCKEFFFFKEQILKLGEWKNCKNDNDINLYFKKLLNLFKSIKKYGVKTNIDDNLEFMVDRNYNLVKINSGNHRFAISRILKLKSIPIEIKLIHSDCFKKNNKTKINIKDLNFFIRKIELKYN